MTTISTLVNNAYRQDNIIPLGQSPSSNELTEGITVMNSVIRHLLDFVMGELAHDWKIPDQQSSTLRVMNPDDPYGSRNVPPNIYNPHINKRLVVKIESATTVYFPAYPSNGSRMAVTDVGSTSSALTLDANGRKIEGSATLAFDPTTDAPAEWFYRADLGNWVRVTDLESADESPFPRTFDPLLETLTSIWLCPRNGREPSSVTQSIYNEYKKQFLATYKQEVPTPASGRVEEVQSSGNYIGFSHREF